MVKELNKDISRLYLVYQHDRNRHIQELIPNRVYVAQILAFNGSLTDGPSYSSKTIIITTLPGGKLQEGDEESNAVNKATISFFFFYTLSWSRRRRTIYAPLPNYNDLALSIICS